MLIIRSTTPKTAEKRQYELPRVTLWSQNMLQNRHSVKINKVSERVKFRHITNDNTSMIFRVWNLPIFAGPILTPPELNPSNRLYKKSTITEI